jgi:hypothetical protein
MQRIRYPSRDAPCASRDKRSDGHVTRDLCPSSNRASHLAPSRSGRAGAIGRASAAPPATAPRRRGRRRDRPGAPPDRRSRPVGAPTLHMRQPESPRAGGEGLAGAAVLAVALTLFAVVQVAGFISQLSPESDERAAPRSYHLSTSISPTRPPRPSADLLAPGCSFARGPARSDSVCGRGCARTRLSGARSLPVDLDPLGRHRRFPSTRKEKRISMRQLVR